MKEVERYKDGINTLTDGSKDIARSDMLQKL